MPSTPRRATAGHREDSRISWLDTRCQPLDTVTPAVQPPVYPARSRATVTASQREENSR